MPVCNGLEFKVRKGRKCENVKHLFVLKWLISAFDDDEVDLIESGDSGGRVSNKWFCQKSFDPIHSDSFRNSGSNIYPNKVSNFSYLVQ